MKFKNLILLMVLLWGCFYFLTPQVHGQGTIILKLGKELTESIAQYFGKKGVQELAEFGGEKAIQELLEKAFLEGGENLTKRVVFYGKNYGVAALTVIKKSPQTVIQALDSLPDDLVTPAFNALRRNPATIGMINRYGNSALEIAAKHPGVGTKITEKLGKEGIETGIKLSTRDAVRLTRYADDIANLPTQQRKAVLDKIAKASGNAFEFLEKHPKTLLTAAGVTAFIAGKEELLSSVSEEIINPDGTVIRKRTYALLREPLLIVSIGLAIGSFLWLGVAAWKKYKFSQLEHKVAEMKAEIETNKLKKT